MPPLLQILVIAYNIILFVLLKANVSVGESENNKR